MFDLTHCKFIFTFYQCHLGVNLGVERHVQMPENMQIQDHFTEFKLSQ